MDTSNPAVFVNGELLKLYIGKKVRTVIQIIRSENDVVHGKSADDQQLIIKGSPPSLLTQFVEVIGTAESPQSINADKWHNFGDTFGNIVDLSNCLCSLPLYVFAISGVFIVTRFLFFF